jgi:cytochrome c peroxidase
MLSSRRHRQVLAVCLMAVVSACSGGADAPVTPDATTNADPVTVLVPIGTQSAVAGVPYTFDPTRNNSTFSDPRGTGLTYVVTFTPALCGLTASSGRITGTPHTPGTITVAITATDASGRSATHSFGIAVQAAGPIVLSSPNTVQGASVGQFFTYDATKNGTVFSSGSGAALTYTVTLAPNANGLTAAQGRITGTPLQPLVMTATIVATDASGNAASNTFPIVSFGADLVPPQLPATTFAYSDATAPLPAHFFTPGGPGGAVIATDNTPAGNPITDAGATLGRVLFYDRRLSVNDQVSCASCHQQRFAFSDTARLSRGFAGGLTGRHSMGLANARFYQRGRFFWDERAATLEAQVLQPIVDATEMGMTLANATTKLTATSYYPALFQAAFGTPDITTDRVSRALAQFVRSMVSGTSRFDQAFVGAAPPNFAAVLTADELAGQQLFNGPAGCARCHGTNAFVSDDIHNTGLDGIVTDLGAGRGRFKAPSLKNIAVRPPYMHDGRFQSLEQVVDFYNTGVQNTPDLDNRLRGPGGGVTRLNLSLAQRNQLVAFMRALTDTPFLTNPQFGDPFTR